MTPPILARVAQLHGSSEETADCDTISTTTSWEYVSKSSSLSDLTRLGAAFAIAPNNHDFAQSSSVNQTQNPHRSFLPHGIVPLPPPHRHAHSNNGFYQYRLTQKDLLQPQPQPQQSSNATTNDSRATPPIISSRSTTKDDSNPVMRSTSFNLDYGAARRHTNRFRQSPHANSHAPQPQRLNRGISGRSPHQKQAQQAIVLVAENPESGACDVYNVPFQSDIYSLPVDSIAPEGGGRTAASKNLKASSTSAACSNNGGNSQHNQNQRLKSETVISSTSNVNNVTPAPRVQNQLSRRKSRDFDGEIATSNGHGHGIIHHQHQSSQPNSKDLHPVTQTKPQHSPLDAKDSTICKPPQRWSSLSAQPQPRPPSPLLKELPPSPLLKELPPSPSPTPPSTINTSVLYAISAKLSSSTNHQPMNSSVPSIAGKTETRLIPIDSVPSPTPNYHNNIAVGQGTSKTNSSLSLGVTKKPRSRSVDPNNESEHHYRHSIKRTVDTSNINSMSTCDINFDNPNNHSAETPVTRDHSVLPLPPEPDHTSQQLLHGATNKENTNDRKNPLGLSFLNLFRRNKNGGKQANAKSDFDGHDEFGSAGGGLTCTEENFVKDSDSSINGIGSVNNNNKEDTSYCFRELPPPPPGHSDSSDEQGSPTTSPVECRDFAASIEKVKDKAWYWGPLSSEAAEDLLKNEPDGSFIVRDSSDARYIFSLTFKLHGLVRHVRIEHDQGNFSFGPLTRFKANTIVDFVEKAVAHSRSGRYLFFLHRRPILGPMQVQLLHPYSRFMRPRSLKHMCRFVILKFVRRDQILLLPLPKPLQDYLNTPHYYFEERITSASNTTTTQHNNGPPQPPARVG